MKLKKFLCTLSGDDYAIIGRCENRIQYRFAAIGAFVFLIFVLCFVSCYFTFTQLFQSYLLGIPAGLFFAFMITNIYLLLLYTLSKHVLPHDPYLVGNLVSLWIRVAFVGFIAVVISKPIEVMLFSVPLAGEIKSFKEERFREFENSTNDFFDSEIVELKGVIADEITNETHVNQKRLASYNSRIDQKEKRRVQLLTRMRYLVDNSNYYVRSIVILNSKFPSCWLITILIVGIFLVPAYIKRFIPASGLFYGKKNDIETRLIKREYEAFKTTYSRLLSEWYGKEIVWIEFYSDPPFNTTRKFDNRKFRDENDLIAELYG
jgi:hypothetical protein